MDRGENGSPSEYRQEARGSKVACRPRSNSVDTITARSKPQTTRGSSSDAECLEAALIIEDPLPSLSPVETVSLN